MRLKYALYIAYHDAHARREHASNCVNTGVTPSKGCACVLHAAIEQRDIQRAQKLIEGMVDVNKVYTILYRDTNGKKFNFSSCSPLFAAVQNGDSCIAVVRMLVDNGADVNAKDSLGEPVLFRAVRDKSIEIVKVFANYESLNVNVKNSLGETVLEKARNTSSPIYALLCNCSRR